MFDYLCETFAYECVNFCAAPGQGLQPITG